MGKFVQVGVAALRKSNGLFLESQPLYIEVDEEIEDSGMTKSEENIARQTSGVFLDAFREYYEGMQRLKRKKN